MRDIHTEDKGTIYTLKDFLTLDNVLLQLFALEEIEGIISIGMTTPMDLTDAIVLAKEGNLEAQEAIIDHLWMTTFLDDKETAAQVAAMWFGNNENNVPPVRDGCGLYPEM